MPGSTAGSAVPVGRARTLVAIAVRRRTRTNQTGRCAVLYPAIAEAARRVSADAVGLIDVGCSAGLNLIVDRVGITYSNGQSLGDPSSAVQLSSSVVGDRPIPARAMPEVVSRVGVDLAAGRGAGCWRGWQTPSCLTGHEPDQGHIASVWPGQPKLGA